MHRKLLTKKLSDFAREAGEKFPLKQVIFYGAWQKDMAHEDDEIEVAVIFDLLEEDLLEVREKLESMARVYDSRIEITIIERDLEDKYGFYRNLSQSGQILLDRK